MGRRPEIDGFDQMKMGGLFDNHSSNLIGGRLERCNRPDRREAREGEQIGAAE